MNYSFACIFSSDNEVTHDECVHTEGAETSIETFIETNTELNIRR